VLARELDDVRVVHRQPLAVELRARAPREDLVDLRELRDPGVGMGLLVSEDRAIEHVLEPGLEVAVHVGEREHLTSGTMTNMKRSKSHVKREMSRSNAVRDCCCDSELAIAPR